MKKVLLGTSALIAAGIIASPAAAQLEVTVGGYVDFTTGFGTEEHDGGSQDDLRHAMDTEAEANIAAAGVADIGIYYGGQFQLQMGADGNEVYADEAFTYLSGTFGSVQFGMNDGAADNLQVHIPGAGTGIIDGAYGNYLFNDPAALFNMADTGDTTKITYQTDGLGGAPGVRVLQDNNIVLGLSYAVENSEGVNGIEGDLEGGDWANALEFAARWQPTFGPVGLSIGAGGAYINDFENACEAAGVTAAGVAQGLRCAANDDDGVFAANAGITGTFGGFSAGVQFNWDQLSTGNEFDNDQGGMNAGEDRWSVAVGLGYVTGPWSFAGQYMFTEDQVYTGLNAAAGDASGRYRYTDRNSHVFGIGASYDWMPGVVIDADLVGFATEGGTNAANGSLRADNAGVVGVTRVNVNF